MVFDEPNGKRIFFHVQDVCFESDGVDVGGIQQRCLKDLMCEQNESLSVFVMMEDKHLIFF